MIMKYPYTDYNEYNLDWCVTRIRDLSDAWAATHTEWSDVQTEWTNYKNYIDNYFAQLDLSQEVSDKLDQMAADGSLDAIIAPYFADAVADIPSVVTDWLEDHVDPATGYVIDNSLTIALAAADAKTVGDRLDPLEDMAVVYPKKYTAVAGTLTASQMINKYGQYTTPAQYSTLDVAVTTGKTYRIYGYYFGGNFPVAVGLTASDQVVDIVNGTTTGQNETVFYTVSDTVTHVMINTRPSYGAGSCELQSFANIDVERGYGYAVVGTDPAHYEYTNINTAVSAVGGSVPVEVSYGVYTDVVENLATNKIIIGKNRELCSIVKTNGDYDVPPVEIAGGIIENLTLNMTNDPLAAHTGYALHSDDAATAGNTLIVKNCHLICSGAHTVGLGIREDEKVIFENCVFDLVDATNDYQPVYIHNTSTVNDAEFSFINCVFNSYGYAMKLQAWGSGNKMIAEFIDCTINSELYGHTDEAIWTDYVSGSIHDQTRLHEFSGKMELKATSHGNNVNLLNA